MLIDAPRPPAPPTPRSLDVPRLQQVLPAVPRVLPPSQLHNVSLGQTQLLVLHNEQRPAAAPIVGVEAQLL